MKRLIYLLLPLVPGVSCSPSSSSAHIASYQLVSEMDEALLNKRVSRTFEEFIASPGYRTSRDVWKGAAIEWYDPKQTRVEILLNQQRGRLYIKNQIAMDFPACSGKSGSHDTPKGSFRISEKKLEHRSTLYGAFVNAAGDVVKGSVRASDKSPAGTAFQGTKMPYWMRFNGAIGMHTGPVLRDGASHGCVRIPPEACSIIYEKTAIGTPVIVK